MSSLSSAPYISVRIFESTRSVTTRSRDIRFYRPSSSLRSCTLSPRNPDLPVSSGRNLSREKTTPGRLSVEPTVVPASSVSTLAGNARSIAHYLRASKHSTLEQRSARLRDDRVSFFRAKDFYRSLREDPDFVEKECTIGGKTMDDKIEYLGNVLLHCGLIQRCERIYKAPRKGRTKRVKYPHYLEKTKNQSFAYPSNDDDSFYAWTYDQPMSWTFLIASWAVAILVMLACLFPLAPIWFKKIILYLCVAILMFFTVILVARGVVFAGVWLVSGRHFWILPNIASDEIPINEVFSLACLYIQY